jgi:hypothetical protein
MFSFSLIDNISLLTIDDPYFEVRLGQVRLGQVRLGQVRLGQVRLG